MEMRFDVVFVWVIGSTRQSDVDSDWRNGFGKDDADNAVSCRGRLHGEREDWLHAATTCRCHVGCQTSFGGVRLSTWPGGQLASIFVLIACSVLSFVVYSYK